LKHQQDQNYLIPILNMMHKPMYYGNGSHANFSAPFPDIVDKVDVMSTSDPCFGNSGKAPMFRRMNSTPQEILSSSHENDAPMVTPSTSSSRSSLSTNATFLRKSLNAPPLSCEYPNSQQHASSCRSSSFSSYSSQPQNPLDLLSTVSSQVADKENDHEKQQLHDRHRFPSNPNEEPYLGERNSAGQRHGRGIMTYPNGCHYSGCFVNDKRHGFGECRYPNGCVYTGFWSNGKRDGVGKMVYADRGDVYEGEWMNDCRHGRGIYFRADGRADVSRYVCHSVAGEGTQWSPNREFVVRTEDGVSRGRISVGMALEIGSGIGVSGVPKKMIGGFPCDR